MIFRARPGVRARPVRSGGGRPGGRVAVREGAHAGVGEPVYAGSRERDHPGEAAGSDVRGGGHIGVGGSRNPAPAMRRRCAAILRCTRTGYGGPRGTETGDPAGRQPRPFSMKIMKKTGRGSPGGTAAFDYVTEVIRAVERK